MKHVGFWNIIFKSRQIRSLGYGSGVFQLLSAYFLSFVTLKLCIVSSEDRVSFTADLLGLKCYLANSSFSMGIVAISSKPVCLGSLMFARTIFSLFELLFQGYK